MFNLEPVDMVDAINFKYPQIKLEWLKQEGKRAFVKIEDANTLHFSFQEWQGKVPKLFSETTNTETNQPPKKVVQPHLQKAGISAALARTASRTPW